MLYNLADHIVASSFRYVVHFIYSRFAAGNNTLYEKRSQIPHELRLEDTRYSLQRETHFPSGFPSRAAYAKVVPRGHSHGEDRAAAFSTSCWNYHHYNLMIIVCLANYKEEAKGLFLANQSRHFGLRVRVDKILSSKCYDPSGVFGLSSGRLISLTIVW